MPQQNQNNAAPDFIPAESPDFIPAAQPSQPEGFLESLGHTFGIGKEENKALTQPRSTLELIGSSLGPAADIAKAGYQGFMRSTGELGKGMDELSNAPSGKRNWAALGSHAISSIPFIGPAINRAEEQTPPSTPGESFTGQVGDVATSPGAMGTITGTALQTAPLIEASGAVSPIRAGLSDLNQRFNPLPLRSRAVNTLETIGKQAANVPVQMQETTPAIESFRESVATGGRNTPVMTKLGKRVDRIPQQGDVLFPEARKFYTNVSRASARPGFLRRAIESPNMPDLRRNVGNVKEALNSDITKAAEQVGRGEDYLGAQREYANNAKLRKLGLIGATAAGAELARRSGLLGTIASKVAGQ